MHERDFSYWPGPDDASEGEYAALVKQASGKLPEPDGADSGTCSGTNPSEPESTWSYSDSEDEGEGESSGARGVSAQGSGLIEALDQLTQSAPMPAGRAMTHSSSEAAMAMLAPDPAAVPCPEHISVAALNLAGTEPDLMAHIALSPFAAPRSGLCSPGSLDLCSFEWSPALQLDLSRA